MVTAIATKGRGILLSPCFYDRIVNVKISDPIFIDDCNSAFAGFYFEKISKRR